METLEINILTKSWNELTRRQVLELWSNFYVARSFRDALPSAEAAQCISIFQSIYNVSFETLAEWQLSEWTDEEDAIDGAAGFYNGLQTLLDQSLAEIMTRNADTGQYQLLPKLTRSPWPEIAGAKNTVWFAPAIGWDNLSIYELAAVFTHQENYHSQDSLEDLYTMLAILYRPGKPATPENKMMAYGGDRRLPYRNYEGTVSSRAKLWKNMHPTVINILAFWALSCRQAIIDMYPRVFKAPGEAPQRERANDYSWGGVILSLAGGVANIDAVADQNFHNCFTYLSMLEDERLEREMWGS